MNFSEKLIKLRKEKGLSQEELGYKLNVTRQTVSKWELGQSIPETAKMIEISKLFEVNIDNLIDDNKELTDSINNNEVVKEIKETTDTNTKKIKLPLKVILVSLAISLLICGIGLYTQMDSARIEDERKEEALEQSQLKVDAAEERLSEIDKEVILLEEELATKSKEQSSLVMTDPNYFQDYSSLMTEISSLRNEINTLGVEKTQLTNASYTVYYDLIDPMTYNIFYIIGGSILGAGILGAFIIYLVKGKKTY